MRRPLPAPPVTSTPVPEAVAAWRSRAVASGGPGDQVPVDGWKSSVEPVTPDGVRPPITSTRPSGSSVALCRTRGVAIEPVVVQVPVAGS